MAPHSLRDLWKPRSQGRQRQRIVRYFDCTWSSEWGEERCRVSSLSVTGCYVEGRFSVPAAGTMVRNLSVVLPNGTLTLEGMVISAMRGVGFAVRFTELDPVTREGLRVLVQGEHH